MKSVLNGKTVVLGITGGIAAYKTPELVRLLKKAGANVQVLLTDSAKQFVTPTALGTVSENPVLTDIFPKDVQGSWTVHIHLARKASVFLVAPATANTIAKLAHGLADNILTNIYLALPPTVPVIIAPAMDTDMFVHPATQANLEILRQRGHIILPPESGLLASGLTGIGRLPELTAIVDKVNEVVAGAKGDLSGKTILISAGPTREAIDPVRYISNYSSGKMGFALASAAQKRGATVQLISGPVHLSPPVGVDLISVESALDMQTEIENRFIKADVVIMAAAVADYRVKSVSDTKIKKESSAGFELELVKNPDILQTLGKKKKKQILIGFALETDNEIEHARQKLVSKNLDAIVLNKANEPGAGFEVDTNIIRILPATGGIIEFPKALKTELADRILDFCLTLSEKNHV
ncbi:MAG: bifunctional phosphopantothenoylcysteine decarboxylase/phosphopantothenate--cysteine ligase CoaBC [Bacteroidetes bacterium]|nr:bifunctional phosphopantothenoylcysteine decarboxylase/phosphopantothenate--cysteine ligase CoaBC [Bacteroidota bacterium]